ncbi:MAG: UvrD-helicase domain-containing protein, partial [bacterium]
GTGVKTKRVNHAWKLLLSKLGNELSILQEIPLEEIEKVGGTLLSEAIRRMRQGEININAGYDGEYGIIKIFEEGERQNYTLQLGFFEKTKAIANEGSSTSRKVAEETSGNAFLQNQDVLRAAPDAIQKANRSSNGTQIFEELNSEQKEAALCTDRPLLILAGPGTGKTRTLTHRIAGLVTQRGVRPQEILAVTFTNKAAHEMKSRLETMLGPDRTGKMTICTFHALGAQILKENDPRNELRCDFSICGEKDQLGILKTIAPTLSEKDLKEALATISRLKQSLVTHNECSDPKTRDLYEKYQSTLAKDNLVDFDDLIFGAVKRLEDNPTVLNAYTARLHWISVDEYQDINFAQYRLLQLLQSNSANICVIGDPDQAIYGFRGASREFFLRFQEDFSDAKIIKLTKNFRSTQTILSASSQVISKSPGSQGTDMWSDIVSKTKIEIHSAPTDKAEAEYVVHEIEKMVGGTSYFSLDSGRVHDEAAHAQATFKDFAVLYRLNAQSRLLIEAFERSGIPYQTAGETPFYERKEVQDLLAYLKFVRNPYCDNFLRNIPALQTNSGKAILSKATDHAIAENIPLWQVLQSEEFRATLRSNQRRTIEQLLTQFHELQCTDEQKPVSDLLEKIIALFYPEKYFVSTKEKLLLEQLLLKSKPFNNRLDEFLDSTALQTETDEHDTNSDRVSLMSLHSAKGLEFPIVFIVGCEEKLLPYQREGKIADIEEERRLIYVGMTRAQKKLILMNAKKRFIFGEHRREPQSRFLADIENALKEIKKRQFKKKIKESGRHPQMDLF